MYRHKLAMVSTIQFAASLQAAKTQLADQFPSILNHKIKIKINNKKRQMRMRIK